MTAQHIDLLHQSGVSQVVIDTDKGLDQAPAGDLPELSNAAAQTDSASAVSDHASKEPAAEPAEFADEARRARRICERALDGVRSLFAEARLGNAVSVASVVPLVDEITSSIARHPHAMTGVVRIKRHDTYTYMHSVAVCALMVALARELGHSDAEVREAGIAGLLHDLGKAAVAPAILNKPAQLDPSEWQIVQTHPRAGFDMLSLTGASNAVREAVLHHHERIDGAGYPDNLPGTRISLLARMAAVCDVYDAVTSDRPYKPGWHPVEALQKMTSWQGHFDRVVLHAFIHSIGIFPVGALVRLESGKLAVVIAQAERKPLPANDADAKPGAAPGIAAPTVKAFFSIRANERIVPQIIELANPGCNDRIVGIEHPAQWPCDDLISLWAE